MDYTLGENIARLRREKSLTQAELAGRIRARGADAADKYISKWEKGYYSPSIEQFLALCDALDVRDIQWEFAGRHTGPLAGFNDRGRKKAGEMLAMLFKIDEYRDEPQEASGEGPRLLRLYEIPVSAGTGNFLDESAYEMIEAPDYVPAGADFALRISGDSMEPLYRDRQIIWVREQPVLEPGEIGVFFYDGGAYCKRYADTRDGPVLRSLNEAYADIGIDERGEFRVIGKVIA